MANVRKYGETFFGRADFLFKAILHHQGGAGDDCARVCCTKIEDFGVRFGEETLFSHVNLHIHCGQLTVIVGPNGGGKSTLLRAILGEVPHTGALHYTDAKGAHTGHPVVGYVPQYLQFDVSAPTTVMDLFMAALSRRPVWLFSSRHLRERVGRDLSTWTVADLRASGKFTSVCGLLESWEQPAFGPVSQADAEQSIRCAVEEVSSW